MGGTGGEVARGAWAVAWALEEWLAWAAAVEGQCLWLSHRARGRMLRRMRTFSELDESVMFKSGKQEGEGWAHVIHPYKFSRALYSTQCDISAPRIAPSSAGACRAGTPAALLYGSCP